MRQAPRGAPLPCSFHVLVEGRLRVEEQAAQSQAQPQHEEDVGHEIVHDEEQGEGPCCEDEHRLDHAEAPHRAAERIGRARRLHGQDEGQADEKHHAVEVERDGHGVHREVLPRHPGVGRDPPIHAAQDVARGRVPRALGHIRRVLARGVDEGDVGIAYAVAPRGAVPRGVPRHGIREGAARHRQEPREDPLVLKVCSRRHDLGGEGGKPRGGPVEEGDVRRVELQQSGGVHVPHQPRPRGVIEELRGVGVNLGRDQFPPVQVLQHVEAGHPRLEIRVMVERGQVEARIVRCGAREDAAQRAPIAEHAQRCQHESLVQMIHEIHRRDDNQGGAHAS